MRMNNELVYCTQTATNLLQFSISIYQSYKNELEDAMQIRYKILESCWKQIRSLYDYLLLLIYER